MKKLLISLFIIFATTSLSFAELSVSVSSNDIKMGETFSLDITEKSSAGFSLNNDLDISALEKDFNVIGSNKSVSTTFINGKSSATNKFNIKLSPKKSGKVLIPSLTVGKEKTSEIYINVTPPDSKYKITNEYGTHEIFAKATVDDDMPLINSQVIYILRVYVPDSINVINGTFGKLFSDKAIVEPMGKITNYETKINNIRYRVFEGKYTIFPTQVGEVKIDNDGVLFVIEAPHQNQNNSRQSMLGNNFKIFAAQKEIFLKQDIVTLDTTPKPLEYEGKLWIPAQSLTGNFHLPNDQTMYNVGDAIDISITLHASGLIEQLLPQITIPEIDGLKIYSEQGKEENYFNENANATKTFSFAVIPTRAGTFSLPSLDIPWYNTVTGKSEILKIPETYIQATGESIEVPEETFTKEIKEQSSDLPSENHNQTSNENTNTVPNNSTYHILIGLLIGVGACILLFLICIFIMKKGRFNPNSSASQQQLKMIKNACKLANPKLIQEALLNWARKEVNPNITNLIKISENLDDKGLKEQIDILNKAIYTNQPIPSDPMEIYNSLEIAIKSKKMKHQANKKDIPNLYPFS